MSTPPRRLRFAVGSSLLTASLSLTSVAGCDSKSPEPDTKKQKQDPVETVNEGPQPDPKPEPTPEPKPEPGQEPNDTAVKDPGPEPEPVHVNEGPEPPELEPEPKRINSGPVKQ